MADANWASEIHSYYNVSPYWEDDEQEYRERRTASEIWLQASRRYTDAIQPGGLRQWPATVGDDPS